MQPPRSPASNGNNPGAPSELRGPLSLPLSGFDLTPIGVFSPSSHGGASVAGSYESDASFKLFVGCLPYEATEDDLRPLFEKFGDIVELSIQRDRSGFSKGCAWLRYTTKEACDDAIAQLHGQFFIGSVRSPIQVKYAAPDARQAAPPSGRLLLTGIHMHATDPDVVLALSQFGEIVEYSHSSRGSGTIRFARPESAELLVSALRKGPISIAGYPCYTLKALPFAVASTSSASRTPPSFAESPVAPVSRAPDTSRPPNVITPANNIPLELLTPAKLFVGCLPYSKSSADLATLFGQYGPLLEVALLVNPDGRSKGASFITFAHSNDATEAQKRLDGYVFPNSTRPINVSFATNQNWRPTHAAAPTGVALGNTFSQQDWTWAAQNTSDPVSSLEAGGISPTASNLQHLLAQIIGFDSPLNRMNNDAPRPPGFFD